MDSINLDFLAKDHCRPGLRTSSNHSTVQRYRARLAKAHYSEVLEAAFSPAKYAVFSSLGTWFLQWSGAPSLSHSLSTNAISAKVGCIGGTFLTILYLVLMIGRTRVYEWNRNSDAAAPTSFKHSASVVLDEMFYSTIASGIGVVVYLMTTSPPPVDPVSQMLAGALGPLLLVVVFLGCAGAVWTLVKSYTKLMDWYTGYN